MLKKVRISGFKSVLDAQIELGRVNLFIGGNGSGKSNLLEALGVLSASLKDLSEVELQRRGVRLSVPTLFKSAFLGEESRSTFGFEAEFDDQIRHVVGIEVGGETLRFQSESLRQGERSWMSRDERGVSIDGGSPRSKADIDSARGLWDIFRPVTPAPEAMDRELRLMARYAIYAPQTAFLRGTAVEPIPVKPLGLHGGGLAQGVQAILPLAERVGKNKAHLADRIWDLVLMPGWIEDVVVSGYDSSKVSDQVVSSELALYFVDKFIRGYVNELHVYDVSEGILFILFVCVLLLHKDAPKIFAMDNVDNALNPAMTRRMLETVIMATCSEEFREAAIGPDQVFFTSHNPTSLDAFDLFDDDQRVFVVARGEDGATRVTRLRPDKGWERADWVKAMGGRSLSELWIEGKIKGALGL